MNNFDGLVLAAIGVLTTIGGGHFVRDKDYNNWFRLEVLYNGKKPIEQVVEKLDGIASELGYNVEVACEGKKVKFYSADERNWRSYFKDALTELKADKQGIRYSTAMHGVGRN